MKAIFIIYNQAFTEKIDYMFNKLNIRGFSQWTEMLGRGSIDGEPHLGTHTWPELNSARITIVEDDKVDIILEKTKNLDKINTEVGVRVFVWNIEKMI